MKASSLVAIVLLCCAVLVCVLYVRARYLEYRRVQEMLDAATNLVMGSLFSLQSDSREDPFWELWTAIYMLSGTKIQRWLFERAVKNSPLAEAWPIAEVFMRYAKPPATNMKRLLFPCI